MNALFKRVPIIDDFFKGIGQIMLQENRWTGMLFFIGICIRSRIEAIALILATASGTLIAMVLKYDKSEIRAGLYGFSPALVGVALSFQFQCTLLIWVLIVLGGALASILQHFFIRKNIPAYTFPFIIVTWVFVYFVNHFLHVPPSDFISKHAAINEYTRLLAGTNGFGEVIFQAGSLSGIIFFIAVFISSPIGALFGLAASVLAGYLSYLYGEPVNQVYMGLFGFNAVLSAIVFAGNKKVDGLWVLVAVLFTVMIDIILVDKGIFKSAGGVLTFPFVLGTCLTLLIQKYIVKMEKHIA